MWNAVNSITMQMIHFVLSLCVCCAVCAQICNSSTFFQEFNFISDSVLDSIILARIQLPVWISTNKKTQSHKSRWFGIFLVFMHNCFREAHVCVCVGLSYDIFFAPHLFLNMELASHSLISVYHIKWTEMKWDENENLLWTCFNQ